MMLYEVSGHASTRVPEKQLVPANESVARQLAIPTGAAVVRIQRVRLADHSPLSFDESYLPQEIENTSCGAGHQPVDYEKLYYRRKQVRFVTRLARRPAAERRPE